MKRASPCIGCSPARGSTCNWLQMRPVAACVHPLPGSLDCSWVLCEVYPMYPGEVSLSWVGRCMQRSILQVQFIEGGGGLCFKGLS